MTCVSFSVVSFSVVCTPDEVVNCSVGESKGLRTGSPAGRGAEGVASPAAADGSFGLFVTRARVLAATAR
ncbi:hypothetical protein GCM10027262_71650 [Nocardia tengchongensis]